MMLNLQTTRIWILQSETVFMQSETGNIQFSSVFQTNKVKRHCYTPITNEILQ